MIPHKAFILAAGLGTRLRPYTDKIPKPMVEINGQSLIQRIIEQLETIGVSDIYINTHYKAEIIEKHLTDIKKPRLHIYREHQLLNTGGGIKQALNDIGNEPFFAINGDSYTIDPINGSLLEDMAKQWDPEIMDILLALEPVESMKLTQGVGDYTLDKNKRCHRSINKTGTHMFSSIRIHNPHIFNDSPDHAFSYLELMDKAQDQGRLYGFINTGVWHHISTAKDLETVRNAITDTKPLKMTQNAQ